ncbi:helix-turn-helix domain-containing protein [Actinacidiphila glaucinigra]|uniref:helix-turn-helix domain-containing protein n=1 Tax=Actinacidiphila glaucinigra TaxID=235986 RepID=UPI0035DB653C
MFRLDIAELLKAAAAKGDRTGYAIHKRAGVAESSVYRYLRGQAQPDLISILLLASAYDTTVEKLMPRADVERIPA